MTHYLQGSFLFDWARLCVQRIHVPISVKKSASRLLSLCGGSNTTMRLAWRLFLWTRRESRSTINGYLAWVRSIWCGETWVLDGTTWLTLSLKIHPALEDDGILLWTDVIRRVYHIMCYGWAFMQRALPTKIIKVANNSTAIDCRDSSFVSSMKNGDLGRDNCQKYSLIFYKRMAFIM